MKKRPAHLVIHDLRNSGKRHFTKETLSQKLHSLPTSVEALVAHSPANTDCGAAISEHQGRKSFAKPQPWLEGPIQWPAVEFPVTSPPRPALSQARCPP